MNDFHMKSNMVMTLSMNYGVIVLYTGGENAMFMILLVFGLYDLNSLCLLKSYKSTSLSHTFGIS